MPSVVSANQWVGPTSIIWCTAGVSGIEAPAIRASFGLQTPQAMTTISVSMSPRGRAHAANASALDVEAEHLRVRRDREPAGGLPAVAHDRPGLQRVDDADGRRVETAEDHALVDERDELLHLVGSQERHRLDPPRLRRGHATRQFLHPLLGPRDLDAARLGENAHLLVLAHALRRELRHLLRVVDREDEVRRVAGRAPRVRERPLVEQDDVRPALVGEVVGDAVADDPAADDDGSSLAGEGAHCG